MADARLVQFYNQQYKKEGAKDFKIPTFPLLDDPRNRFEAAVKVMHQYFKGGSILEVGSGNGMVAASLLETNLPFDNYVLTDMTKVRVDAAKKVLNDDRFSTLEIDIESEENWPLKEDQKYDCILMVALIEHLIDPISAMKRLQKHLKKGGFIYVMTPNVARMVKRIRLLMGQFPATSSHDEGLTRFDGQQVTLHDEGHLHYFTFNSLERLLTEYAGFSKCEKAPYFEGQRLAPQFVENSLAKLWPEMFSELGLIAYK